MPPSVYPPSSSSSSSSTLCLVYPSLSLGPWALGLNVSPEQTRSLGATTKAPPLAGYNVQFAAVSRGVRPPTATER
eukprot:6083152-Pyramimonas_sp.AAC.1